VFAQTDSELFRTPPSSRRTRHRPVSTSKTRHVFSLCTGSIYRMQWRRQLYIRATGTGAPSTSSCLKFNLELHKISQRLCAVASPKKRLFSVLFRVILFATKPRSCLPHLTPGPGDATARMYLYTTTGSRHVRSCSDFQ